MSEEKSNKSRTNPAVQALIREAVARKIDEMVADGDLEEFQKDGTTYLRLTVKSIKARLLQREALNRHLKASEIPPM